MKNNVVILALMLAVLAVLASCAPAGPDFSEYDSVEKYLNAKKLAEAINVEEPAAEENSLLPGPDYTLEQALADGCKVYVIHGTINKYGDLQEKQELISNGNRAEFIKALSENVYTSGAVAFFEEDGKLREYGVSVYDENGYHHHSLYCRGEKPRTESFDYLYLSSYTLDGRTAYIFTNDESVTVQKLLSESFSSQMKERTPESVARWILS